jgi:hypothetical protein
MKKVHIKQLLKATPQDKCKLCIEIIKGNVKLIGGQDGKKARSKHNVDLTPEGKARRTVNGITFDSEDEADYYEEVILPDKTITNFEIHPKYLLQESFQKYGRKFHPVYYEADFEVERGLEVTVIDVKGLPTETALLKRKLFDKRYPDKRLEWVSYSKKDGGWIQYDELKKLRSERKKAKKKAEKAKLII